MSAKPPKTRMLSVRITEDQFQYLENVRERIKKRSGFRITRASIILKLMEYGVSKLNQEIPPLEDHEK